jgi:hypothetical protein
MVRAALERSSAQVMGSSPVGPVNFLLRILVKSFQYVFIEEQTMQ